MARKSSRYNRKAKGTTRRRGRPATTSKATGRPIAGPVVNFMPHHVMRKLHYVQTITINPSIGGRAHYTFRSNDLYDPDLTSTLSGHQPRGFDQLMTAYNRFTVIGSKITVTQLGTPSGSTNGYLFMTHGKLADPLSGEANDSSAFESQFILKKPLLLADAVGNNRKIRISSRVGIKKFFKASIMTEDGYSGTASNSPTNQSLWTIYYQNLAGSDPDSQPFLVELEYIAIFRDPKQFGAS